MSFRSDTIYWQAKYNWNYEFIYVYLKYKKLRMNTKLTLSIEEQVIESAKEYAKKQGRSLSNIVEEYLKSIAKNRKPKKNAKMHPLVEELCGSVKLSKNISYDEVIKNVKFEKYSKR